MATELETKIMGEIGLSGHYSRFNGSGSCKYIRENAASKLADVLDKEGFIVDQSLIRALKKVSTFGDELDTELTKTWQAASDIIRAHIDAKHIDINEQPNFFNDILLHVEQQYLPEHKRSLTKEGNPKSLDDAGGKFTKFIKRGTNNQSIC